MDNFVDKLAQKFNAQEMIRANAQAEASELKRLQEQVATYEAILQDMRKLNYKNSELTDKINELVDESIRKMQNAQQNSVDSADAADISSNLSEAIMVALNDALSNMDSKVGMALNESVNNTLMIPVGEMKQSTQEVSGSVAVVRQIAEDFKASADDIRYATDLVKNVADDVNLSVGRITNSADEVRETALIVRSSTEEIRHTTDELKESTEDLKSSVKTSVDNALLAMRRENREIADHLEYIRSTVDTIRKPSEEEEIKKQEEEARKAKEEEEKEQARLLKEEEEKKHLEELFKQSDDFVHKENVKVYRNVQAVVLDEFKNQTEGLAKNNTVLYEKLKSTKTAVTVAIVLGGINIVLTILSILNII